MVNMLQITTIQAGYPHVTTPAALLEGCHPGRYHQTMPPQTITCRPPHWAGHSEAEQRFFFGGRHPADFNPAYHFPPTYLAAFPAARLVGDGYVVVAADNRILQDSYSGDHILQRNGRFLKQNLKITLDGQLETIPFALRRPAPAHPIEQTCLLPTHYWHFNYHHWLIESLPRLRYALDLPELATCPIIVPAALSPFQQQSLQWLGVPAERLLPFDGSEWQLQSLLFPSIGIFAPAELEWVRQRCLAPVRSNDFSRPTRYYISRTDATTRRLLNEDEIATYLQQQGFEILTLTSMPFAEQVARFAAAQLIIGPHGSGLTNLLFAPSNATLVELMPHDQVNHCFWLMTNILNQRYTFLSGPPTSPQRHFTIPLPRLQTLLTSLL